MNNHVDLADLQPIPLRRLEMSQAMCILDDLLVPQRFDGKAAMTATTNEEKRSSTSNKHEGSLADADDDILDHLSAPCIEAFNRENVARSNKETTNNKPHANPEADSLRSSSYSRYGPTSDQGPHDKICREDHLLSPYAAAMDGGFRAFFYPLDDDGDHGNNDHRGVLGFSLDSTPPKRHSSPPPANEQQRVIADPRHPYLQYNPAIQPSWRHFPDYYHYYDTPSAAPTAASTNTSSASSCTRMWTSMPSTLGMTAGGSTSRPPTPPQAEMMTVMPPQHDHNHVPHERFRCMLYPRQQEVGLRSAVHSHQQNQPSSAGEQTVSRPVVSPASNNTMDSFPQPLATTGTGLVATPQPQSQEKPTKKQRGASKKPKARASLVTKSNKTSKEDPPNDGANKKTSTQKQEFCILKPIHHLKWQRQYNNLLQFRRQHGHCHVPIAYEALPTLSHWVKRQRNQYKQKIAGQKTTLTDERQQILDYVGFVWDSHQALWSLRLDECRMYRDKHGHCSVPARYAANAMLAVWAKCQRRQFKLYRKGGKSSLTIKRVNELNALGFVWDPLGLGPP